MSGDALRAEDAAALLGRAVPFRILPERDLEELAGWARSYRCGSWEVLVSEGAAADAAWIVRAGRALLLREGASGLPVAARSAGPGETLLLPSVLGEAARWRYTVQAPVAAEFLRIPAPALTRLPRESEGFARALTRLRADWEERVAQRLTLLRVPSDERLARVLAGRAEWPSGRVRTSRRELALLSGESLETVFRCLRRLRGRRVVGGGRGDLRLLREISRGRRRTVT